MESDNKFFYSNGLQVAVSPFDINLKFLRQGAPDNAVEGKPMQPQVLDEIIIAMSPAHAKAMLSGLFQSIMSYEKDVGPIALPADLQKAFNETFTTVPKK